MVPWKLFTMSVAVRDMVNGKLRIVTETLQLQMIGPCFEHGIVEKSFFYQTDIFVSLTTDQRILKMKKPWIIGLE